MSTWAQLPPGGAPSPNSLLNDLRSLQFGSNAQGQGSPMGGVGGGMGTGLFGGGGGPPPTFGAGAGIPAAPGGAPFGTAGGVLGGAGMGAMGGGFGGPQAGGMGAPMGGGFGGTMGSPMGAGPGAAEPPLDLECTAGPRAAAWGATKNLFRTTFADPSALFKPMEREALVALLETSMKDLKAAGAFEPDAADECGLGKLCLQLLSLASMEDTTALAQIFAAFEQISSPAMTTLLDIPWLLLVQARWPFFGLLSQMSVRKSQLPGLNVEALDGTNAVAGQQLSAELASAIQAGDMAAADKAAATYLQSEPAQGSALGQLTALAAQAAGAQAEPRAALLQGLQQSFKQVIGNGGELDIALSTRLPLWGLLHMSIETFPL